MKDDNLKDIEDDINDSSDSQELDVADDENDENIEEEAKSEIEILREENEDLNQKLAECSDKYVRLAAEFKNFQERNRKEKIQIRLHSLVDAVSSVIPIVDDIERTLPSFKDAGEKYAQGVNMILKRIYESFKSLGVEIFGEKGEEFDPSLHNASSRIEGTGGDKTIISSVYQKGYKLKDIVIRPAMVQVTD